VPPICSWSPNRPASGSARDLPGCLALMLAPGSTAGRRTPDSTRPASL